MKRFFKENFWWLILTILLTGAIVSLILNVFWLKKLILAPFAFLGICSAIKGFCSIVEKFVDNDINRLKGGLCLLTFAISIIALAMWIIEW